MRLLLVHESPLEKIGEEYYAVDPWIRFPQHLAAHCDRLTLWSPVRLREAGAVPSPESWAVHSPNLRIAPHDDYHTFIGCYALWPRRVWAWRRRIRKLLREHDAVLLRHPSPLIGLVARAAVEVRKPLIVLLVGDLAAQSDRVHGSRGLKRLLYRGLARFWVGREIRWCREAALLFAYGESLAARHRSSGVPIVPMQTPHVSESDFVFREDTCVGSEIRLLRVCWLVPSKGLEILLEAVAALARQGMNVKLDVLGKERVKGYQASLQALAAGLGIADRVTFHGWIPFTRLRERYLAGDIQVISSLAEGVPRVIVEGAAHGLPLVCTASGGSADRLTHEREALVVPPGDADALAGAIRRIVENPALRRSLIHQGYRLARAAGFETKGIEFLEAIRQVIPLDRAPAPLPAPIPMDALSPAAPVKERSW